MASFQSSLKVYALRAACALLLLGPLASPDVRAQGKTDAGQSSEGGDSAKAEKTGAEKPPVDTPAADTPTTAAEAVPEKPPEEPVVKALRLTMDKGDLKSARFLCDLERSKSGQASASLHKDVASRCAKVYLALGDAYAAKGSVGDAHVQWSNALAVQPSLNKDFLYLSRLRAHPKPSSDRSAIGGVTIVSSKPRIATKKKDRPKKPKATKPVEPPGPRGGKVFGIGLTGGFDGLVGLVASFLYAERLSVEVSVGVLFPTIDTRVRLYGSKDALTPAFGFGMSTPLDGAARFGLDVPGYTALYRLGQTVHVDIGLAWRIWEMDLFGGMAFITSLDQEHLDRLLFFPQFGLQGQFMF